MSAFNLYVVLLFLLATPTLSQRSWDRFKYIDSFKTDGGLTNYMFRGNEPAQHGQMQYDWLVSFPSHFPGH